MIKLILSAPVPAMALDCMVSAANSFGLMDGSVDEAITAYFGIQLQQRVQKHIVTEWLGYHGSWSI